MCNQNSASQALCGTSLSSRLLTDNEGLAAMAVGLFGMVSTPGGEGEEESTPTEQAALAEAASEDAAAITAEEDGDLPTYHRLESPTQTSEDAAKEVASGEVWGQAAEGSNIPKVKAYSGPLPEGALGIEFTTDVPPDSYGIPGKPTWSGPRPGVIVEDDLAKICAVSIWTNQC